MIEAVPCVAISLARIAAVTWLALFSVVTRGLPLKFTTEAETKPVPLTIRLNPAPPAFVAFGTSVVIVGAGFVAVIVNVTGLEVTVDGNPDVCCGAPKKYVWRYHSNRGGSH